MRQDRLNKNQALRLLTRAPLLELMRQADAMRRQWHPRQEVTFVIDSNPNYTNVCSTRCTFCSFYRPPGHREGFVLSPEEVAERALWAEAQGATTLLLQGGHHPELGLEYYLQLIQAVRRQARRLHLHFFSPAEIAHIGEVSSLKPEEVLQRFWDAGLRTMPGGGAEILVDRVRRQISPKKIRSQEWLDIMRAAHQLGMKTSATMTYGHIESEEDIIEHLLRLRALQDETGGFYAFIPWSFKPGASPLALIRQEEELPSYYVRIIAIARLVLDNFPHIQASWFGEGWRAGQLALHGGADDFGGVLLEENVLFQAQHQIAIRVESVCHLIAEAGFEPVQRTTLYEEVHRYEMAGVPPAPPTIKREPTMAGAFQKANL